MFILIQYSLKLVADKIFPFLDREGVIEYFSVMFVIHWWHWWSGFHQKCRLQRPEERIRKFSTWRLVKHAPGAPWCAAQSRRDTRSSAAAAAAAQRRCERFFFFFFDRRCELRLISVRLKRSPSLTVRRIEKN